MDGLDDLIDRLVVLGLITKGPTGRYSLTPHGRRQVLRAIDEHPILAAMLVLNRR